MLTLPCFLFRLAYSIKTPKGQSDLTVVVPTTNLDSWVRALASHFPNTTDGGISGKL